MTSPISNPPTLAGFVAWSQAVMGIKTIYIAPDDIGYTYALQIALAMVPTDINIMSPDIYTLTVYNWAGSQLLQYQQDIPGQTFFETARQKYGINNFVAGVIKEAADQATSQGMAIGHGLQNLTLVDLQRIKDPYGRQALAYLQTLGTLWGLS